MVDKLMHTPEIGKLIIFVTLITPLINAEYLIVKGMQEDKISIPVQTFVIAFLLVCPTSLIFILITGVLK